MMLLKITHVDKKEQERDTDHKKCYLCMMDNILYYVSSFLSSRRDVTVSDGQSANCFGTWLIKMAKNTGHKLGLALISLPQMLGWRAARGRRQAGRRKDKLAHRAIDKVIIILNTLYFILWHSITRDGDFLVAS
jgi:hypothetical protein